MKVKLLSVYKKNLVEERTKIVATAGKLSRSSGNVLKVYKSCDDYEKNKKFIERVIKMGHDSITDHDYLVFAIEDVSPYVELTLIKERFASFTIKSRREVNFEKAGYYVPDFKDNNLNIVKNNNELKKIYKKHMNSIFREYSKLVDKGVKKEDARFILPYSFNNQIVMGIDAHVLKDLILRLTKGKESNITELKELGKKLYEIMENYVSYLKGNIDNEDVNNYDSILELLNEIKQDSDYKIVDKTKLISYTPNIDSVIITNALMRVFNYEYEKAYSLLDKIDKDMAKNIIKEIALSKDKIEFKSVNFNFQFSMSLATLPQFVRHRTQSISIPDLVPTRDFLQYKIPKSLEEYKNEYNKVFEKSNNLYKEFKKYGVRNEDLIYLYINGMMMNITTNLDGATLAHILRLRICNKAQWEIREISNEMRDLVCNIAPIYGSVLGSDCEVFGICKEGKESCGKINYINRSES